PDYRVTEFNTRFDMPELRQNLDRLVALSEKNLIRGRRDHQRDLDQVDNLGEERERLRRLLAEEKRQLAQIEDFSKFAEQLQEKIEDRQLTVAKALTEFEDFLAGKPVGCAVVVVTLTVISNISDKEDVEDFKKSLKPLGFDQLIIAAFGPLLRQELRSWKAFE